MMEGTTFGKQIPFGFTTSNIYVIRNSDLGLYKIGYSDDVQRRLKALQSSSCHTLDVLASWEVPGYAVRAFEACIHMAHIHCRTHGEWFELSADEAANLRDLDHWCMPALRSGPKVTTDPTLGIA